MLQLPAILNITMVSTREGLLRLEFFGCICSSYLIVISIFYILKFNSGVLSEVHLWFHFV